MFYWILKIIFYPLVYLYFKPKIYGRKNLQTKGRTIVVCNHVSFYDPVLISFIYGRRIYWMAKRELFNHKALAWLITALGAFPVSRGTGDLSSIRYAMRLLHDNKVMGIFPEGTRIKTGELGQFEPGMAMMALKTESTILPIYIDGRFGLFKRSKVVVGEKINLNEYTGNKHTPAAVAEATEYLHTRMTLLKQSIEKVKKN